MVFRPYLHVIILTFLALTGCISSAIWVGTEIVRQGEPAPESDQEYEDLAAYLEPSVDTIYSVQLGAYSNKEIALNSLDRFGSLDEELWIYETKRNGKALILILYGRFAQRSAAVEAADQLKSLHPDIEFWLRALSKKSLQTS